MLSTLLNQLPEEASRALQSILRAFRYERGHLIYHTEDAATCLFWLQRGRVRLYRLGNATKEVTVAVQEAGDLFGEIALNGGDYGMYAEALEDCEVWAASAAQLRTLMQEHPALLVAISAQLTGQLSLVQTRFNQLVFLEVAQRLAHTLLKLAEQDGEWVQQHRRLRGRISHQDLAYLVGSTRETITKLLGEFKEKGLLDLGYRRIILLDEKGLRELATRRTDV